MRIHTVSDLHVDCRENMHWVLSLSQINYLNDILLIAGDLSHHLGDLKKVFVSLKKKFRAVHFGPGNHELWFWTESMNVLWKNSTHFNLCVSTWMPK
ncbi:MAG: metallophosphoesterase [Gammaproteobacteria bacterium]|nr:metallophosphoesterase [Gammaproteobacteria bacterium]